MLLRKVIILIQNDIRGINNSRVVGDKGGRIYIGTSMNGWLYEHGTD